MREYPFGPKAVPVPTAPQAIHGLADAVFGIGSTIHRRAVGRSSVSDITRVLGENGS